MKLWKVGAIIVALFALAGAATGFVAAQTEEAVPGAGRVSDFVGRLAENLGISQEELEAAIDETQLEIIDEKVADGTLTEEEAAALRERVESGEGPAFLFPKIGRGHHGHGGYALYEFAEAAGLTVRELIDAWGDDQTLQQVLEGLGVDVAAVKAEVLAALEARLTEAVANDKIDQARADEVLANSAEKLDELLAQVGPPQFPPRPFRGEFGEGRLPDGAGFPGFPAVEPVDAGPIF